MKNYNIKRKSIAFYVFEHIHIPHNLREYYLSKELINRGWKVIWLLPKSGSNDVLTVDWPIEIYPKLDFRGHKFLLPTYLAQKLIRAGVDILWVSGWSQRDPSALYWLIKIIKGAGIKVIYDPIDPIDLLLLADNQHNSSKYQKVSPLMNKIYDLCDIIFTVTPQMRNILVKRGVQEGRVKVARWGTDISRFDKRKPTIDFKQKFGLSPDVFLIGWLGAMNHFKGIEEIILPLIKIFVEKYQNRVHFVIAGYGLLEEYVKDWITENSDLPVTLTGRIDYNDAPSFTASLDAYLVPTSPKTEFARSICPVKCFDAIAMGVDLLVTETEATSFLKNISTYVHLCNFSVESFQIELEKLVCKHDMISELQEYEDIGHFSQQFISKGIVDNIEKLI